MKKIIFILSPFLLFVACGPQGLPVEHEGQVVTTKQQDSISKTSSKKLIFNMGEDIQLGDYVVKVNKVLIKNALTMLGYPDPKNKFYSIEIEYFNPTQDKQINSNPSNWTLIDEEDYIHEFDYEYSEVKKPELVSIVINPGNKVKGWISFLLPSNTVPKKIQFQPDNLNNANIEITLDKTSQ